MTPRHVHRRDGRGVTIPVILMTIATVLAPMSGAVHTTHPGPPVARTELLELDGGIADAAPLLDPPTDWDAFFACAAPASVPCTPSVPAGGAAPLVSAAFTADHAVPDASYHGTSKDIADIPSWECTTAGNPQAKDEILNSYAAIFTDAASGHAVLFGGLERKSSNGNAFAGMWLLRNPVACTPQAPFSGAHTVGDLLVLANFTGGGATATTRLYKWIGAPGGPSGPANLASVPSGTGFDCATNGPVSDAACGTFNTAAIVPPWAPAASRGPNQFIEFGLDLTLLLGMGPSQIPCFAQLMFETRSAPSLNADLKDFTLTSFESCDARISIGPSSARNDVGTTHALTIRLERRTASTGPEPVTGQSATASIVSGPGSFVGTDTCTTGPDGTCTVTITSAVAGTTTVKAAADVVVESSTLHVETDGQAGNSPPATKTWERVPSTTTTTPSATSIPVGDPVNDLAIVAGGTGTPTGTVSFFVCAVDVVPCASGGTPLGVVTLDGSGAAGSTAFTPTVAGDHCFRGEYSGDVTYLPSTDASTAECFTATVSETPELHKDVRDVDTGGAFGPATAARPGDTLEYRLTYHNHGGSTAPAVVVTDTIPAATTFVSCASACSTTGTAPGSVVSWGLGDVAAGGTAEVFFSVLLDASFDTSPATVTNVATATDSEGTQSTSPPATASVSAGPVSELHKRVGNTDAGGAFAATATGAPGDVVEYELVYHNHGSAPATAVVVTETVPARTTFLDCTASCATTGTTPGETVTWSLGAVAVAGSSTMTWRATLSGPFPAGVTPVANVATISTAEEGPIASNQALVDVSAGGVLDISKTASLVEAIPGGPLTYIVTYANSGDGTVTGVVVQDTLPAGTTFRSCMPVCAVAGPVIAWAIGPVAAGATGQVAVTVDVRLDAPCVVCNVATVSSADAAGGAPVESLPACVDVGPNAYGARAGGGTIGLKAGVVLSSSSSTRIGPGTRRDHAAMAAVAVPPGDGGLAQADVVLDSATSTVSSQPLLARQVSVSEVLRLDVLDGLVTADVVRAAAVAESTDAGASYSSSGSTFENLTVAGALILDVAPNTRIELDPATFGPGSFVALNQHDGSKFTPAALAGGTHEAHLIVTMVWIHITSGEVTDLLVSQAIAHTAFPQTARCVASPAQSAAAHAFVLSTSTAHAPTLPPMVAGLARTPGSGGTDSQRVWDAAGPDPATVRTGAGETRTSGTLASGHSSSSALAHMVRVCLLETAGACLVSARAVEAVSASSAGPGAGGSSGGVVVHDLEVAGVDACPTLAVDGRCRPAPGTVIELGAVGALILNEQVADAPEPGVAGLVVRAMHLILADGTDLVVAEAYSSASHA